MATITKKGINEKLLGANSLIDDRKKLSVAIGIPAYNEQGRIGLLLRQILYQNNSVDEIILNTGGSTDGTREEVISVIKRYNASHLIKIVDNNERTGKAGALDEILKNSTSDIVIFLDGDVKLHNKCFDEILKPFLFNNSVGVVGGNVASLNADKEGLFSFISKLERQMHHELCVDLMREGKPPKVNGTFFAVKRNAISCLPRHVVSDDEYVSWNAQRKGYRVVYAPKALVYTKDPENFKDYIVKRRRIFVGHFLIKKTIGYTVPTTRFRRILPKLLNFSLREKSRILDVLLMSVMQFAAYVLAVSDMVSGDIPYRYRVESAKF